MPKVKLRPVVWAWNGGTFSAEVSVCPYVDGLYVASKQENIALEDQPTLASAESGALKAAKRLLKTLRAAGVVVEMDTDVTFHDLRD